MKFTHINTRAINQLAHRASPVSEEARLIEGIRLHTAINQADFVSCCMLYTYDGNKMHSWENDAVLSYRRTIKSHSPGYEIDVSELIIECFGKESSDDVLKSVSHLQHDMYIFTTLEFPTPYFNFN